MHITAAIGITFGLIMVIVAFVSGIKAFINGIKLNVYLQDHHPKSREESTNFFGKPDGINSFRGAMYLESEKDNDDPIVRELKKKTAKYFRLSLWMQIGVAADIVITLVMLIFGGTAVVYEMLFLVTVIALFIYNINVSTQARKNEKISLDLNIENPASQISVNTESAGLNVLDNKILKRFFYFGLLLGIGGGYLHFLSGGPSLSNRDWIGQTLFLLGICISLGSAFLSAKKR